MPTRQRFLRRFFLFFFPNELFAWFANWQVATALVGALLSLFFRVRDPTRKEGEKKKQRATPEQPRTAKRTVALRGKKERGRTRKWINSAAA